MSKTNPSQIDALVSEARAKPDDMELAARAARALESGGRPREGGQLLLDRLKNLTAHDPGGPLPCLCRRCIQLDQPQAQSQSDRFYREFSIASGRVLFYWVPAGLPRTASLSRAVGDRMGARLRRASARRSP